MPNRSEEDGPRPGTAHSASNHVSRVADSGVPRVSSRSTFAASAAYPRSESTCTRTGSCRSCGACTEPWHHRTRATVLASSLRTAKLLQRSWLVANGSRARTPTAARITSRTGPSGMREMSAGQPIEPAGCSTREVPAVDHQVARLGDERQVDTAPAQSPIRRIQVGHHLVGDIDLFHRVAVSEGPPKDSLARQRRAVVVRQEFR